MDKLKEFLASEIEIINLEDDVIATSITESDPDPIDPVPIP